MHKFCLWLIRDYACKQTSSDKRRHLVHVQIYVQDSLYLPSRSCTQLPYAQHDVVIRTPPCAVLQHMCFGWAQYVPWTG